MTKPLVLVDGSSYLFRAFHALPNLANSEGKPTNAMLGVINMLRRLQKDRPDSNIVVVFDAKGKNFRHTLYPDYKANRIMMPDDLRVQIEPLYELIQLMGYPLVIVPEVEADDVIGTLTQHALKAKRSICISTGDKDMAQLIQPGVTIIDTMKNVEMNSDYVFQKFGVYPQQVVDYLALVGDTSDNIPGIPNVGPKTAAKWLAQYGTLENLKAHAHEISGKVGDNLRAHMSQLDLAKTLATIVCDVDLPSALDHLSQKPADNGQLLTKLQYWGFNSWLKDFEATHPPSPIAPTQNYTCIITPEDWQAWQTKLLHAEVISIDTETTSLDALQAKLVGVSFSVQANEAAYLPLQHTYLGAPTQLPLTETLPALKCILENPRIKKVGQNLKYDMKVLQQHGIKLQGLYFDTMLASYILESGQNRHDLTTLAKKHLGRETISYESITGKGAKQILFCDVTLEQATCYAAEDADITFQLYEKLQNDLHRAPKLEKLFFDIEMALLPILADMEMHGVMVDTAQLYRQSQTMEKQLSLITEKAYLLSGCEFNLASPKQLLTLLYDKMQLPILKKTPKGQPSTSEEVLQALAESYEFPKLILEHRHLSKLKSTYTDKLPTQVHPVSKRIHTSYHQAVASTGRLSSSDPNLQNIPTRSEQGRQIRQAFIAPPGFQIIAADYSQIELRIMAHLSGDQSLLTAFAENRDIHTATASEVFGVPLAQVDREQRRRAKAINFGLIYGMSAFGLAKQLGIGRNEAQTYVNIYFQRYPGVAAYMENTRNQAREQGYVETLFGRRLYLPDILSRNPTLRNAAERAAINAPMQGTAADIIKRAMIAIHTWLQQTHPPIHMVMQVHDELVFEVQDAYLEPAKVGIRQHMTAAADLDVPLDVEIGVGPSWEAAH